MGIAFWRRKKASTDAASSSSPSLNPSSHSGSDGADEAPARSDATAGLRARARRRLIGAAALLLAVAIVVPMVLDPAPKPVPDNIAIDIPSEKTPFAPRVSLPAVPEAGNVPSAPLPDQPPPDSKVEEAPPVAPATAPKADAVPGKSAPVPSTDEQRARDILDGKATAAKAVRYAVQVAAPASESAARDLAARLKKNGFASFTEKVEVKDGTRYRVRVGPFVNRSDADKARDRLKTAGIGGNVVAL